MKLATPFEFQGQEYRELKLPVRMKVKYLRNVAPAVFTNPESVTYEVMMEVVEGIFQLPSGTAGEMTLADMDLAFDAAMFFLGWKSEEPTTSSAGDTASGSSPADTASPPPS